MPWVSGSSQRFSGKVYSVSATRGLVLEKSFKSFIGSFVPSNLEAIGHRKAVTGLSQWRNIAISLTIWVLSEIACWQQPWFLRLLSAQGIHLLSASLNFPTRYWSQDN